MRWITLAVSIIAGLTAVTYLLGYVPTWMLGATLMAGFTAVLFDLYLQRRSSSVLDE
jgi:hypothetical protein